MDSDRRRKLADADLFLSRSLVDEKVARMAALPAYEQIDRDGEPLLDCHADYVEEVVDLPFDTDCDYPCMAENLETFPDLYPDGLYGTAPPGGHMLLILDEAAEMDMGLFDLMLEAINADPPAWQRAIVQAVVPGTLAAAFTHDARLSLRDTYEQDFQELRDRMAEAGSRFMPHFVVAAGKIAQVAEWAVHIDTETLGT